MKRYILDAHNILYANAEWSEMLAQSLVDAREALVEAVRDVAARLPEDRFTIVFDGSDVGSRTFGAAITVRGTRSGQKADDVIKNLIRNDPKPRSCYVVSSDAEVAGFARRFECKSLSAKEFVAFLHRKSGKRKPTQPTRTAAERSEKPTDVSPEEIATMKRLFGL